jgi:sulfopyruvate decarboxylase subunit alpha
METAIPARDFWATLKDRGYLFYAGVPDSTFGSAYGLLLDDPDVHYVPAVREDVALGVASGAYFAGSKGAVVMQNSGLGNIVNPLTSFSLMYCVPVLLIVGWRGYGGSPNDAPEHWIMGEKTSEILTMLDVPFEVLEPQNLDTGLDRLTALMDERTVPGALLVRHGVIL